MTEEFHKQMQRLDQGIDQVLRTLKRQRKEREQFPHDPADDEKPTTYPPSEIRRAQRTGVAIVDALWGIFGR